MENTNTEKKDPVPKLEVEKFTEMPESLKKQIDSLISIPLRSANRLMNLLYKDDKFYETATHAWTSADDSKKLFLYGVCKEVMKVCIGMMGDEQLLQETPDSKKDKQIIEKIIYGEITDSQSHRIRKMNELLGLLMNFFVRTKSDEEYRVYLNAENLDRFLSRQKEFKEFYPKTLSHNIQSSIDCYKERILADLKSIKQSSLWFLNMDNLKQEKPSVFISKRKIYFSALEFANADERIALGVSYDKTYSRLSMSIHPLLGSHDYGSEENDRRHVLGNISMLAITCMHVMHQAYKLSKMDDPEGIDKIMGKNFEKSRAQEHIRDLMRQLEIGDIILTKWGDLGEIVDGKESKFGYRAYKVKFISNPPIPEYPEDWMEVQGILRPLISKKNIRPFYENAAKNTQDQELKSVMLKVLEQPDAFLEEATKKTFLDLHTRNLLIPMLLKSGFIKPVKEDEDPFDFDSESKA